MAQGLAIKDVDNKLESLTDDVVIPVSSGDTIPEVVQVGVLKRHVSPDALTNEEIDLIIYNSNLATM